MTYIRDATFGGAKGALGELVFEWNRTDLTQWEGSSPSFDTGGGSENSVLSVEAVAERGNVLRFAGDGVSSGEFAMWLLADPIDFPDERRDMVIECEWAGSVIPGTFRGAGPVFLSDDAGDDHFQVQTRHNDMVFQLFNNGARSAVGTHTGVSFQDGGRLLLRVFGDKPSSAPPRVTAYFEVWTENQYSSGLYRQGSSDAARGGVSGPNVSLGSSWDAETLDRVGFGLGSATQLPTADILDFRVYLP